MEGARETTTELVFDHIDASDLDRKAEAVAMIVEKEEELRQKGLEERKKNDEYQAWLETDHIRTVAERGHERADPSKMHEGGKFSGIPTDFTPDK